MIIQFTKCHPDFSYSQGELLESGGAFTDAQLKEFIDSGFAVEELPKESIVNPEIETADLKTSDEIETADEK